MRKGALGIPIKTLVVLIVIFVIAAISLVAILYGKNAFDMLLQQISGQTAELR